ncbi:hypothetical protein R3P38DRAFT_2979472 [Favolaschia claudopus]|uniref:Uncharacterized protein n=1 Tax=Favolaschia claudopus TaxID=2862362 RepID=A0AAW0B0X5_9AGAR
MQGMKSGCSSSYDSCNISVRSVCSSHRETSSSHKDNNKDEKHTHAKIRKPRRSVDSERSLSPPPALSPSNSHSTSSSSPSPTTFVDPAEADFDFADAHDTYSPPSPLHDDLDDDFEQDEEERVDADAVAQRPRSPHTPSAFRKHWAALSLRVRFGVFRAKRRMRDRVMSL